MGVRDVHRDGHGHNTGNELRTAGARARHGDEADMRQRSHGEGVVESSRGGRGEVAGGRQPGGGDGKEEKGRRGAELGEQPGKKGAGGDLGEKMRGRKKK